MTTELTARLERIKAECRDAIELAGKATDGPWTVHPGYYPGFSELRTPDWTHSLVTVATDLSQEQFERRLGSHAFIATSRTITPKAAQALLTAIEGLGTIAWLPDGGLDNSWTGTNARETLKIICDEWERK